MPVPDVWKDSRKSRFNAEKVASGNALYMMKFEMVVFKHLLGDEWKIQYYKRAAKKGRAMTAT